MASSTLDPLTHAPTTAGFKTLGMSSPDYAAPVFARLADDMPPVLTVGGEVTFVKGHTLAETEWVVLDPFAQVYDAELEAAGNYAGSKLVISTDLGSNSGGWFGSVGGRLLLYPDSGEVRLDGNVIGTFTNEDARLEIVFTDGVTGDQVNETMSSLAYKNGNKQAGPVATITWEFFDSETGGNHVTGTSIINIENPPNDAATEIRLSDSLVEENSDTLTPLRIGTLTSVDSEPRDTHTYSIVGDDQDVFSIAGDELQFQAGTTLDYETKNEFVVVVRSTDTWGATYDQTLTIELEDVNDAPVVVEPFEDRTIASGKAFTISGGTFDDEDHDDTLTYAATLADGSPLPDWLVFDDASLEFHGEAPEELIDGLEIRVTATDREGLSVSDDFTLSVAKAPAVEAIVRDGAMGPTNQDSLAFLVTFSQAVEGVTPDDFELAPDGDVTGNVSNVELVEGSDKIYAVTVDGVTGDGMLGLRLKADSTGITSVATGLAIIANAEDSESYEVDNTPPVDVSFVFRAVGSSWNVTVTGLEDNATWHYSLDGGEHWSLGEGADFTAPRGTYAVGQVMVYQTDAAGNDSDATTNERAMIWPRPAPDPDDDVPADPDPDPSADLDGDGVPDALEAGLGLVSDIKDNDVFARDDLFVMQVYRDVLGREADDAGLAYWQDRLEDGDLLREDFVKAMLASDEAQDAAPLVRLSLGLLDRSPELQEMQDWRADLAGGMSRADAIEAFVQQRYGELDDAEFIGQLYEDVLSRQADEPEAAYWTDVLQQGWSWGEVALDFTFSDEFLQDKAGDVAAAELYLGLLGREADGPGLAYWGDAMEAGMPVEGVILSMMGSVEYHDRFLPEATGDDGVVI